MKQRQFHGGDLRLILKRYSGSFPVIDLTKGSRSESNYSKPLTPRNHSARPPVRAEVRAHGSLLTYASNLMLKYYHNLIKIQSFSCIKKHYDPRLHKSRIHELHDVWRLLLSKIGSKSTQQLKVLILITYIPLFLIAVRFRDLIF